ncbi:hypothetical protein M3665_24535 [Bacillus licheniformis]|jgi:hypothetical protein|nr:hypothetical protein [Bacillus licheniformis]DAH95917.1 MAG TPA: hypothetical protein [Caudoviricetes sp.]DAH95929.1 MAG TPA: hypothetical protein [Caudoviricetes sp.]
MVIDLHNYKFWREVCRLSLQKQQLETSIAAGIQPQSSEGQETRQSANGARLPFRVIPD